MTFFSEDDKILRSFVADHYKELFIIYRTETYNLI